MSSSFENNTVKMSTCLVTTEDKNRIEKLKDCKIWMVMSAWKSREQAPAVVTFILLVLLVVKVPLKSLK